MNSSILEAREKRIHLINNRYQKGFVILCVKANIPGENKNINEAHILVRLFTLLIQKKYVINFYQHYESADGPYAIFQIMSDDAIAMKQALIFIEDTHPLGRFIDLDLYDMKHHSLSRSTLGISNRKCYICGKDAHVCSRSQSHSTLTLISFIKTKIQSYLSYQMEHLLYDAIIKELELEDKFGLVTKSSQGSHPDMDYNLMKTAADVILPYFVELFIIGYQATELETLLSKARPIGILAEAEMLKATHGINAYKGLIYVLGLTCLSLGYSIYHHQNFHNLFDNIRLMSSSVLNEFNQVPSTAGLKAYQNYQIKGIRGEAHHGLPSVRSALDLLTDCNDSTLRKTLKHLILVSEDTVLLKRAKTIENYNLIKDRLTHVDLDDPNQLKSFNQFAVSEQLSFGGSADLLVVTIFLKSIQNEYFH